MTTTLLERTTVTTAAATAPTNCQVYAGSLLAPCPNTATRVLLRRGTEREVCPAHA